MEPITTIMSNMTGGQLITFLVLCVIVSMALQIATWRSTRSAMRRQCELLKREHDEQRAMLLALLGDRDGAPPMSDPLPPEPEQRDGGLH